MFNIQKKQEENEMPQTQEVNEVYNNPITNTQEVMVTIDGNRYAIRKLKFGDQADLASIMAGALKGLGYNIGEDDENTDTEIKIDIGAILASAPTKFVKILAMGLGLQEFQVRNFENSSEALAAMEKVLEINPIGELMGKSTALLKNMKLS